MMFRALLLFSTASTLVNGQCALCDEGVQPPSLTRMLDGVSCAELFNQAANEAEDADCSPYVAFGILCDCRESVDTEEPTIDTTSCSLCPDGSAPPDPDLTILVNDGAAELSCGEIAEVAANTDPSQEGSPSCTSFWPQGIACGCDFPRDGCDICFDGSDVPDPGFAPPELDGDSCGVLQQQAALDRQSVDPILSCEEWLEEGLLCSCPSPEPDCKLCEDGSDLPQPDLLVDELNSCFALESRAEDSTCEAFQATAGVYCGCNNPQASEGYCRICGDGILLPDPSVVAYQDEAGFDVSCARAELNRDGLSCDELRGNLQSVCCSEPTPEPGVETEDPVVVDSPTATPMETTGMPTGSMINETDTNGTDPETSGADGGADRSITSDSAQLCSVLSQVVNYLA